MKGCCEVESPRSRPSGLLGKLGRWLIPAAGLALMPKCPACLAVYITLATGVGVSISTAAHLRTMLIVMGGAMLAYLTLGMMRGSILSRFYRFRN